MQETAAVPIWHFSSQHKLLETTSGYRDQETGKRKKPCTWTQGWEGSKGRKCRTLNC